MAYSMTLQGSKLSDPSPGDCKCVYNPRTKSHGRLCFVGKSKKSRSGWQFQKGGSQLCRR